MSDAIVPFAGAELAELMRTRFSKLMQSRIKMSPVHSLRASSIGNDCDMYLFLEQTAHEKRVPHGESLQALFDLGNEMETYTVRLLEDMGFTIYERNRSFHDRDHDITGHLDGRLHWKEWPRNFTVPIEIKGLNPYTADTVETIDHIRYSKTKWVRKYYAQLQTYQYLGDDPWGLFVLLNKSTGHPEFIPSPIDRPFISEMLAKADRIRDAVASNAPPERNRSAECVRCPFAHVCLPDIERGPGVKLLDTPELIEAIKRREANREAHKEFEAAARVIKDMMPDEPGDLLIGPYSATGKKQDRAGFSVPPISFTVWKIRENGPPPSAPPVLDPFTGPRYLERENSQPVPMSAPADRAPVVEEGEFD